MNELVTVDIDAIEPLMLMNAGQQPPCPVVHHFGPGVYIREVTIPKGAMALGHKQRYEHLNVVLRGSVAIYDDGQAKVISGPLVFTGKPGRKIGVCIEDCVWQNVYPNPDNCRDIETLEARWMDKSEIALEYERLYIECLSKHHEKDRQDYARLISDLGISDEFVKAESRTVHDLIELPDEYATRLSVRNSGIEGKGLFVSFPVNVGEVIAPARIGKYRTIAGRYVNHAVIPNCEFRETPDGDVYLVALAELNGSVGGSHGTELTVNYRDALKLSRKKEALQ